MLYSTVPGSPPRNVMVTSANPSSLRVSWQPPRQINRNGIITGYVIEYTRVGGSSDNVTSNTETITSRLAPFVGYSVRVAAMTVNGTGPFSNAMVQRSGEDGEYKVQRHIFSFVILSTQCTTKLTNGGWCN